MVILNETLFLIDLIKHTLNNSDVAPSFPANFNDERFVRLADIHNLSAFVKYALNKYGITLSEKAAAVFEKNYLKTACAYASNYAELDYMKTVFDENGIEYALLKGAVLRELYPLAEMRTGCDIDFLCAASDAKKIEKLMLDCGFAADNYDDGVDCYKKRPFVCFEIHKELLAGHSRFDCLSGAKERCVPLDGTKCGKKLGLDDTYLYMIAHTAKHFFSGGTGVRPIIDLYLFTEKYGNSLSTEFIEKRLSEVKLTKFNSEISALAQFWFGNGEKTELTAKLSDFILSSGIFGTKENADAQELTYKKQKSVVNRKTPFLSKVFLSYPNMCLRYGYLKKFPFLLPFSYIQRIIGTLSSKEKRAKLNDTVSKNPTVNTEILKNVETLITELQIF